MPETPNHNYNIPEQGQDDWATPLNENFRQYDTDIEIRDLDANRSDYEPKDGAKFLATDTGNVYLGDGSSWSELSLGGTESDTSGQIYQQRGKPTTSALAEGEVMTYNSDGTDGHTAGDLVYAINDSGTIQTQVIAAKSDAGGGVAVDSFERGTTSGWMKVANDESAFEASQQRAFSGSWSAKLSKSGSDDGNAERQNTGSKITPDKVETAHALGNGEIYADSNTEWRVGETTVLRVNYNWSNNFAAVNGQGANTDDIENGAVVADLPWPSSDQFFHIVLDNIDWDNNVVGTVTVNGTNQAENVPFFNDADGIDLTAVNIGGGAGNVMYIDDTTVATV